MRGRPLLRTKYSEEVALLDSGSKKTALGALLVVAFAMPWVFTDDILRLLALGCFFAIGAIGLNLLTGYAGQVSLGHAFFVAIGAYTAAVVSGDPEARVIGYGYREMWIWLPLAGLAAALAGVIVAPLAVRLRGLYLAIVTLGLVVVSAHFLTEWSELTGGANVGRAPAPPVLFGQDLRQSGEIFVGEQKMYLLGLVLLIIFALAARNLARSKIGRAFTAVRDRDIAAGVIGVNLTQYKTIAFAISSFYAGCCGALLFSVYGLFDSESFNLLLSVQFIAMILIGGAGTISGAIMGAMFIQLLPKVTRELPQFVPFISGDASQQPNVYQLESIVYGVLIVFFLIFEPRGLFGIWIRVRNYWKAWPFSY